MRFVPVWWEWAQGGLSWICSGEISELDPGGLCQAWWLSGRAWECLKPEAHCSLATFSMESRAFGIPGILPWKTVYCLLGILDIAGIICLHYFSNSKMHSLEEKWTCLFNCNSLNFFFYCFLHWKFGLETEFHFPFLLCSFKRVCVYVCVWGDLEHRFSNIFIKTAPKVNPIWSLLLFLLLLFCFYFSIHITWFFCLYEVRRKLLYNFCVVAPQHKINIMSVNNFSRRASLRRIPLSIYFNKCFFIRVANIYWALTLCQAVDLLRNL